MSLLTCLCCLPAKSNVRLKHLAAVDCWTYWLGIRVVAGWQERVVDVIVVWVICGKMKWRNKHNEKATNGKTLRVFQDSVPKRGLPKRAANRPLQN